MKFPSALALLAAGSLVLTAACEADSQGGFGKPDIKDPGINVKPTNEPVNTPPDFTNAAELAFGKDEGGQLTARVRLKPGFHAYAPGEPTGKPVALLVKDTNGWKVEGAVDVPKGEEKDLGELGKSQVLHGDFALRAKVVGGTGEVEGDLELQVCTENACDRPRKHPFKVPMS